MGIVIEWGEWSGMKAVGWERERREGGWGKEKDRMGEIGDE